jgi:hypothetical protein
LAAGHQAALNQQAVGACRSKRVRARSTPARGDTQESKKVHKRVCVISQSTGQVDSSARATVFSEEDGPLDHSPGEQRHSESASADAAHLKRKRTRAKSPSTALGQSDSAGKSANQRSHPDGIDTSAGRPTKARPCVASMAAARPSIDATCGCGACTKLACRHCGTPVCLECAKAKRAHLSWSP